MMPGIMREKRRGSDEPCLGADETRETPTVPEAAERLRLRVDVICMRIPRGTLPTTEIDGKRLVHVPRLVAGATRRADDLTPTRRPHDDSELLDELWSGIACLRQTLAAEIEARRRANHVVAGVIGERRNLMPQLEAGFNH